MPCTRRNLTLLLAMLAIMGCTPPVQKGKSPLMPVQMTSDSVVLEIFCVRFPFGDPNANEKLWDVIDEQQLPTDLRERLTHNGFRVGLITGQLPPALFSLLELADKPVPNGNMETTVVENAEKQPRVVRRHMQLPPRQRSEIFASGIYDQLPLLVWDSGHVGGQTYQQAQGLFAVKSIPQPDGRVRLELTPELHHDQARPNWIVDRGMMRLDSSRPKQVFDTMTIGADLTPGAFIVITSLPSKPGSLGHHFFTDTADGLEQKMFLIRLSQTQRDGLFDATKPLDIEL